MSAILFWKPGGPHGYMSNWSNHSFVDAEGREFKTAEHYLMHGKALMMGDEETAKKILEANLPAMAKAMGKSVKPWDEAKWIAGREELMCAALRLKVAQNPDVKRELRESVGRRIAEASPFDAAWGIGMSSANPRALNPNEWKGDNLLGKCWERVRAELVRDEPKASKEEVEFVRPKPPTQEEIECAATGHELKYCRCRCPCGEAKCKCGKRTGYVEAMDWLKKNKRAKTEGSA